MHEPWRRLLRLADSVVVASGTDRHQVIAALLRWRSMGNVVLIIPSPTHQGEAHAHADRRVDSRES